MGEVGTAPGSNSSAPPCAPSLPFHSPSHFSGGTERFSLAFEMRAACLEPRTTLSGCCCSCTGWIYGDDPAA